MIWKETGQYLLNLLKNYMNDMESLETLQKIREIEDLSSKKIAQAEEKAKKILEETEKLNEEKIKKA